MKYLWIMAFMFCSLPVMAEDLNQPFVNGEPKTKEEERDWTLRMAEGTDCHTYLSWSFSGGFKSKNAFWMAYLAYKHTYGVRPGNTAVFTDTSIGFCEEHPYASVAQFNQYYWETIGGNGNDTTSAPVRTGPTIPRDIPHVRPAQPSGCRHPAAHVGDPPPGPCPQ